MDKLLTQVREFQSHVNRILERRPDSGLAEANRAYCEMWRQHNERQKQEAEKLCVGGLPDVFLSETELWALKKIPASDENPVEQSEAVGRVCELLEEKGLAQPIGGIYYPTGKNVNGWRRTLAGDVFLEQDGSSQPPRANKPKTPKAAPVEWNVKLLKAAEKLGFFNGKSGKWKKWDDTFPVEAKTLRVGRSKRNQRARIFWASGELIVDQSGRLAFKDEKNHWFYYADSIENPGDFWEMFVPDR